MVCERKSVCSPHYPLNFLPSSLSHSLAGSITLALFLSLPFSFSFTRIKWMMMMSACALKSHTHKLLTHNFEQFLTLLYYRAIHTIFMKQNKFHSFFLNFVSFPCHGMLNAVLLNSNHGSVCVCVLWLLFRRKKKQNHSNSAKCSSCILYNMCAASEFISFCRGAHLYVSIFLCIT